MAVTALAATATIVACSAEPALETRTFELMYMDDDVAADLIAPYVYFDRDGAKGAMTVTEGKLTVRETADNLERIAGVLAEFDKPKPGVRLRFQLIEANGFASVDPEISEVESALRDVFRFEGYRLLGEALVNGIEGSWLRQDIPSDDGEVFHLQTGITDVRTDSEGGSVGLQVELQAWGDALLATSLRVRAGQTAVLGSAALRTGETQGRTLILAVRPELTETP
jgi:hypothetical protein